MAFFVAIVDRLVKTYQNMQRNSNPSLIGLDMSAHNVLENQLVADHTLVSVLTADGVVNVDRSPAILEVGTAGERTLSAPQVSGLMLTIVQPNTGAIASTIKQSGGATFGSGTTLTLDTQGDNVLLVSMDIGGTIVWREVANNIA